MLPTASNAYGHIGNAQQLAACTTAAAVFWQADAAYKLHVNTNASQMHRASTPSCQHFALRAIGKAKLLTNTKGRNY